MYDVVNASKQDDYLHKYRIFFYYLTALIFSGSYVRFMSCQKPCYIVFKQYTIYFGKAAQHGAVMAFVTDRNNKFSLPQYIRFPLHGFE